MKSLIEQATHAESIGQMGNALDLWEQVCDADQTPFSLCSLGRVRTKLELWDQAQKAFSAALEMDNDFSIALECMGLLNMQRTDTSIETGLANAKSWFVKAAAKDPCARTYTLLAAACSKCGDNIDARRALKTAIKLDASYEEAYFNLAILEDTALDEARRLLTRAIQLDPDYALAHQSLGVTEHELHDLPSAEYHYRRAVELNPLDVFSRLYLANLLAVKGDDEAAESEFRAAIAVDPAHGTSLNFFATFLEQQGRHSDATAIRQSYSEDV